MKILVPILSTLFLVSCASLGPKPSSVYHRPELNRPVEKIIVFPATNFSGVQDASSKKVEAALSGKWGELYGKENVVPGGPVIMKLIESTGKDSYLKLIKSLDNVSAVEQIMKDPKIRDFVGQITEKLGNYHLSLAIVDGDEKAYNAKQPVRVHIGFFDTKAMTWKWITKIEDKKKFVGKFDASTMMMVNNSFDLIKTYEKK